MRNRREQAFRNAARILKETGCGAVKLEGGTRMAETIHFLTERGVPVMGHVGLTPQSVMALGSFKAQGREEKDWEPIERDADGGQRGGRIRHGARGSRRAARGAHHAGDRDRRRSASAPRRPATGRS